MFPFWVSASDFAFLQFVTMFVAGICWITMTVTGRNFSA